MKKIIILGAICFGLWNLYGKHGSSSPDFSGYFSSDTATVTVIAEDSPQKKVQPRFRCDGRQHCSQMTSFDEAKYFNRHCPNTKMDGDHDGVPCERQFGR